MIPSIPQVKFRKINSKTISFHNPINGFTPQNSSSAPVEGQQGKSQISLGLAVSIYRQNFIGQIGPGEAFSPISDANSYIDGLPLNAVATGVPTTTVNYLSVMASGNVVAFSSTATANKYVSTTTNLVTTNDNDCLLYKDGAGNEQFIWSWENTTQGDLAIILSNGSGSVKETWYSGLTGSQTLTKLVPHKVALGANKNIYITNGQYLAEVSSITGGTPPTGTANSTKLNLGDGWIATSLVAWNNFLFMCGYKNSVAVIGSTVSGIRVWIWDYATANPTYVQDMEDGYASAIAIDQQTGVPTLFTSGLDGKTRIRKYNGSTWDIVFEYVSSFIGNPPKHGAVENYNGGLHFKQDSGNFDINRIDGNGFNYVMSGMDGNSTNADSGFLKNLDGTIGLTTGGKIGSTFKIGTLSNTLYTKNGYFNSNLYKLPYHSKIRAMTFTLAQFGTGASFTLTIYQGQQTISNVFSKQFTATALGTSPTITALRIPIGLVIVDEFSFKVLFDHASTSNVAAIINSIEFEYEDGGEFKI